MKTWIALLRGINVGGRSTLSMSDLKKILEAAGCKNVRTYIQSGNAVFEFPAGDSKRLSERISQLIVDAHNFEPKVFLVSRDDLKSAIEANPYRSAVDDHKSIHFFFLESPAEEPRNEALECARSPTESFVLTDKILYLFAPDGIGRSKLAANVERHLGVAVTARNYRTISNLLSMTE